MGKFTNDNVQTYVNPDNGIQVKFLIRYGYIHVECSIFSVEQRVFAYDSGTNLQEFLSKITNPFNIKPVVSSKL